MGKKKGAVLQSGVGLLEVASKVRYNGHVLVREAKAEFSQLGDHRLEEATEDWQIADVIKAMWEDYRSSARPEDALHAYKLGRFIQKRKL
jgi:hypothetical protein